MILYIICVSPYLCRVRCKVLKWTYTHVIDMIMWNSFKCTVSCSFDLSYIIFRFLAGIFYFDQSRTSLTKFKREHKNIARDKTFNTSMLFKIICTEEQRKIWVHILSTSRCGHPSSQPVEEIPDMDLIWVVFQGDF